MNVLSIQSHVVYGHVGNAAAVFPLQRMGVEVWPLYTVQFSNSPGRGSHRGMVFDAVHIHDVVKGLGELAVLSRLDGVISGYVGDASVGQAVLEASWRVRAASPKAVYLCDPVLGDVGRGIYVRTGLPAFIRERLVPAADIVTPNHFELEFLTGRQVRTLDDAVGASIALCARGPKVVVTTSLRRKEVPAGTVENLVVTGKEAWIVATPFLHLSPPLDGGGDAFSALFLGHFLRDGDVARALSLAASSLHGILLHAQSTGARELPLIAAQRLIVEPETVFPAQRVGGDSS
ncbi:MAG: pyridoxal kinase PdxY [Alphaproteobacteria bacterium]|nr:pyridoxal kinase PdxY [Alphaproteobacteria bacterium]